MTLKVLTFSSLFPSSVQPQHGIFVETRLLQLLAQQAVEARVVAPVPWFPSTNERYGQYARWAATPRFEQRKGLQVHHPRYALVPKIGMSLAPLGMALGAWPTLRRLRKQGFDFDVIDAHYFYPDGVAAAMLGAWAGRPVVITARGSDVNLIARYPRALRQMKWAAARAACLVGVSQALTETMRGMGLPQEKLLTWRNGVDLERFQLQPDARTQLQVQGDPLLLTVGNLHAYKGQGLAIEALRVLRERRPGARLVIIGAGPDRAALEARVRELGLQGHVQFTGALPQSELPRWFSAADVLVLASEREGWPNVLLESMACGTPVVAAKVGGTPEIVDDPIAGMLVEGRRPEAYAAAIEQVLGAAPERGRVRGHAARFGWAATSAAQWQAFQALKGRGMKRGVGHA